MAQGHQSWTSALFAKMLGRQWHRQLTANDQTTLGDEQEEQVTERRELSNGHN